MGRKKYRLKESVGGYLALTTPSFQCIIKKDDEVELTEQELIRLGKFVEEVKPKRAKKKEIKEEERVTDMFVEDNE